MMTSPIYSSNSSSTLRRRGSTGRPLIFNTILLSLLLLSFVLVTTNHIVSGSTFKFESELFSVDTPFRSESSSSSSSSSSLRNNINNQNHHHESTQVLVSDESFLVVTDDKQQQNLTIKEGNGVALFTYSHESSLLKWEILSKASNITYEQGVEKDKWFVLAHSDYVNETNAFEYWDRNDTSSRRFIILGQSWKGFMNETRKAINIPDLFENLYKVMVVQVDSSDIKRITVVESGTMKNICKASSPIGSYNLRNWKMWIVLIFVVFMLIALIMDVFRPYYVVMVTLIFFAITEVISVKEALEGFSNEGMITIGLLFVVVQPLSHNPILLKLSKVMFGKPKFLPLTLFRIIFPISILSMFLNNTPIVVAFTPLIVEWARENKVPASKILIPLSYATLAGGCCTIIGTSTNLVGSGLMESYGLEPLSFFELVYIGGILLVIMMIYLCLVSIWILPSNNSGMMDNYAKDRGESFTSHFVVPEKSPLAGKSKRSVLAHLGLKSLEIVKVVRTRENSENDLEVANNTTVTSVEQITPVDDTFRIQKGDRLVFRGLPEDVMNLHSITGIAKKVKSRDIFGNQTTIDSESNHSSIFSKFSFGSKKKQQQDKSESLSLMESNKNATYYGGNGGGDGGGNGSDDISMEIKELTEEEREEQLLEVSDQNGTVSSTIPTTTTTDVNKSFKGLKEIGADLEFYELVISNTNSLLGSDYTAFEKHFQTVVFALKHRESLIETTTTTLTTEDDDDDFHSSSITAGDSVLVIAPRDFHDKWIETREFFLITRSTVDPKKDVRKFIVKFKGKEFNLWWWEYLVVPIFIAMVAGATAGYPMIKCVMIAFVLMILLKLINPTKAVQVVDWQLLLLIAGSFGVGLAIKNSGFAEALAELVVYLKIPPLVIPALIFLFTQVCSAVITNTAAVSVNLPLALAIAEANGLNPRMICIIVIIAASSDYTSPIGSTTNLIVQGPGGYKFFDFTKVGLPLNIMFLAACGTLIPLIWGLNVPNF